MPNTTSGVFGPRKNYNPQNQPALDFSKQTVFPTPEPVPHEEPAPEPEPEAIQSVEPEVSTEPDKEDAENPKKISRVAKLFGAG